MAAEKEPTVLVYDVGGSHISAAVCQRSNGAFRLGQVVHAPHPQQNTSAAFLSLLYSLGAEASIGVTELEGAELAMPGPFDFDLGMSFMEHKLPHLYRVDLRKPLAEHFGWPGERVRFLLDAGAFLLGEIGAGSAQGASRVAGITLGTGIGSALAVDGQIVTEGIGVPPGGEIWNQPYEGGIVEDFLSTRAIQHSYQSRTGLSLSVAELARLAESDLAARDAFADFGKHLGRAVRQTLGIFAPTVVVLGGGISRSANLFVQVAERELQPLKIKLEISQLEDRAPLVGAAVAWFAQANRNGLPVS